MRNAMSVQLALLKVLLITLPFFSYSQTPVFSISGKISDPQGQPIAYATIRLDVFAKDTLLLGAITDHNGTFALRNVPGERFRITVSFIGYTSFAGEFDPPADGNHLSFDTIVLQQSFTELQEVVVHGERAGLRALVDKDVFIPDAQSIKSSANGLDLLAKIPGVRVRPRDQEISVAGSNNVLVLVNGASSDRNIGAINPRDIERIELIRNPAAAFESDVLAVINIILKPHREKGWHLATNLEYSFVNLQNNSNAQVEYVFDKIRVFAGYNANVFKERDVRETRTRQDFEGEVTNVYFSDSPQNRLKGNSHRFQYGADYRMDEKNTLSFTGNILFNAFEDYQTKHSHYQRNNHVVSRSHSQDNIFSDAHQHNYNLFYSLKFGADHEVKLNSNLFFMNRTRTDNYTDSTFFFPEMVPDPTTRSEETLNDIRSVNVKVDYTRPVHQNLHWNMGYQLFSRKIGNDFFDSDNAINLEYLDNRNSVYGDLSYKNQKLSVRAGVRLEHLARHIADTLSNRHLHPLPLGSVMYAFNQSHNIGITYNRRLRYPSFLMLIPFEYYSGDAAFVSTGNPDVKPEKQHSLTLRHTYRKNDLFVSTSLYYQRLDDVFGMVRSMENGVLRSKWENIDWASRMGYKLSGNASIFDWVELDADIGIYHSRYSASQYNGWSYQAFFGLMGYLPFDMSLGVDFSSGFSESKIDMHIYESPYIERVSLHKEILSGQGNIGFAVFNPMTVQFNMKSWDHSFEDVSRLRFRTPVYMLQFTFYFSSGKRMQRVQREQIMLEEQIR